MQAEFRKTVLLNIGISVILVAAVAAATAAVGAGIRRKTGAIMDIKKEAASRSQAIQSLAALTEDAARAGPLESQLMRILPLQDELINFPKDLKTLAGSHNLTLGFAFGAEVPAEGNTPGFIEFQMTASGKLADVIEFLRDIHASRYYVAMDPVDITKSGRDYSSKISGRVFSR
jgi:Tfp pilus assembly protein PilO